jgi:DNA-binding response OmpR family regulator
METNKILILEDEELVSNFLKLSLELRSFVVDSVKNGVEGVRKIQENDYDIIVCDMNMPALPGDMFYLAVERVKPHLCSRFIFITGFKDNPRIREFIQKTGALLLAKPFKIDELSDMIAFVQMRAQM